MSASRSNASQSYALTWKERAIAAGIAFFPGLALCVGTWRLTSLMIVAAAGLSGTMAALGPFLIAGMAALVGLGLMIAMYYCFTNYLKKANKLVSEINTEEELKQQNTKALQDNLFWYALAIVRRHMLLKSGAALDKEEIKTWLPAEYKDKVDTLFPLLQDLFQQIQADNDLKTALESNQGFSDIQKDCQNQLKELQENNKKKLTALQEACVKPSEEIQAPIFGKPIIFSFLKGSFGTAVPVVSAAVTLVIIIGGYSALTGALPILAGVVAAAALVGILVGIGLATCKYLNQLRKKVRDQLHDHNKTVCAANMKLLTHHARIIGTKRDSALANDLVLPLAVRDASSVSRASNSTQFGLTHRRVRSVGDTSERARLVSSGQ